MQFVSSIDIHDIVLWMWKMISNGRLTSLCFCCFHIQKPCKLAVAAWEEGTGILPPRLEALPPPLSEEETGKNQPFWHLKKKKNIAAPKIHFATSMPHKNKQTNKKQNKQKHNLKLPLQIR